MWCKLCFLSVGTKNLSVKGKAADVLHYGIKGIYVEPGFVYINVSDYLESEIKCFLK
jgi:hypothetical protein